ncbi:MAG TPA: GyrI-like domain-containing protein [Gemmatimonadaceae bacterium]|jgi:effector-binding domain-containing protein|nr:GyrI-like domain-containing protein [Gemmatimonadaceae bacterium]
MATATQLESMEVTVPPTLVAQVEGVTTEPAEIPSAMSAAFRKLHDALVAERLAQVGPPQAIYTAWGPREVQFTVAVPIERAPHAPIGSAGITVATLPERTALRFVHRGPYHEIRSTYERIESWLRERGGIKTPADWARYSPMWEEYMNDPATTPESELLTHIFLTLQ